MAMRLAFIGFGEAARAFRESLARHDPTLEFAAYDVLLEREEAGGACGAAMTAAGVAIAGTPEAAAMGAEWVFSAVTADQSRAAAQSVAPFLRPGQVFFDINSVSPASKRGNAERVEAGGARYLDMAVMAPVHPRGHRTPVLIAGTLDAKTAERLAALDFQYETAGAGVGGATAIKMVRSLFVKGLEALTVEAYIAAEASGCLPEIRASLAKSYPGLGWPDFAEYEFERVLKHGMRRAAEMRESAATLNELGLNGALAAAIADVQELTALAGRRMAPPAETLEGTIAGLAQQRRRRG